VSLITGGEITLRPPSPSDLAHAVHLKLALKEVERLILVEVDMRRRFMSRLRPILKEAEAVSRLW